MADITLTANEVEDRVPGAGVTSTDITDAADYIAQVTGYTVTEHSDEATDGLRLIPAANVKRAWAIVSARLRYFTAESTSGGVIAESGDGTSYTIDRAERDTVRNDMLNGLPRELLRLNHGTWDRIGPNRRARHYRQQSRYTYPT